MFIVLNYNKPIIIFMKSLLLSHSGSSLRQWISGCLLLLSLVKFSGSTAQWSNSSTTNNLIALAAMSDYKNGQQVISDGAGGAIIVWYDDRNGLFNADIFAQRINASGVVQWTANGVGVCTVSNDQYLPNVVSDGAGGAIIAWQDFRAGVANNPDIYAQRINATGVAQWTTNGVVICNAPNEQFSPAMVADGSGGAFFAWQDARTPGNQDIFAQRIDASGTAQWAANGVVISAASNAQGSPSIASDGAGGSIIAWQDNRSGGSSDVYAQRINASGTVQWAADGVPVSTATGDQYFTSIVSDGSSGAIITWEDFRSGLSDIYAQRINGAGTSQWTADGVAVCTAGSYQYSPLIASDGSNGAIITWFDVRNGNQDIFAQRVNSAGTPQWLGNGVAISTTPETQTVPAIIADGAGGAIITWQDQRISSANNDVYAQRVNAGGAIQWATNGVAIGNSSARDDQKPRLTSDGSGGAIIVWNAYNIPDYSKADIYAQKVNANGTLGNGAPNPCPALLTLVSTADDYSSGNTTKQAAAAGGKIEATNLITGSANVTYEAQSIELKPGFRSDNGTVFKAQVGGCN
jgi:hypothetical protein